MAWERERKKERERERERERRESVLSACLDIVVDDFILHIFNIFMVLDIYYEQFDIPS